MDRKAEKQNEAREARYIAQAEWLRHVLSLFYLWIAAFLNQAIPGHGYLASAVWVEA